MQNNKNHSNNTTDWTYKKSRDFYNIQTWGNSYFDVNKQGQITVKRGKYLADKPVAIIDIINAAKKQGVNTPLILRFTDIIQNRAKRIIKAFNDTKKHIGYPQNYTLIYPIKVNQNKAILNSLTTLKNQNYGLEAGSKAELLAVLATIKDNKTPIICNGYKDEEYITSALSARKCGRNITIVIEKMIEASYVIEIANKLDCAPSIGVRCRLSLALAGKWAHSGGEKSKFGLNTTQLLELIALLKQHNMLQYLHLLHCHQGSQIANIKDIFHYINELSTVYAELYKLGAPLRIIDIGGGLAVDYEGTRTRNFNSTNYSLSEYAHVIMDTIKQTSEYHFIPIPDIYSESGRAITAHHAVLITDIIGVENVVGEEVPEVKSNDPDLLELENLLDSFDHMPINEIYSSSQMAIESIYHRFANNKLSLEKRAVAEQLLSHIKLHLLKRLNRSFRSHRELYDHLDEDLAKKAIANFSLFQSMPDSWAIDQLFPVIPLTHLNSEPQMRTIIEDITCDSDGKITNYIDYQGNEPSLKLPKYNPKDPYLLAVFLIGAYQEIMGNSHNLFGQVSTVEISLDGNGNFTLDKIHHPASCAQALNHVGFNAETIVKGLHQIISKTKLTQQTQQNLLQNLEQMLYNHTYLSMNT